MRHGRMGGGWGGRDTYCDRRRTVRGLAAHRFVEPARSRRSLLLGPRCGAGAGWPLSRPRLIRGRPAILCPARCPAQQGAVLPSAIASWPLTRAAELALAPCSRPARSLHELHRASCPPVTSSGTDPPGQHHQSLLRSVAHRACPRRLVLPAPPAIGAGAAPPPCRRRPRQPCPVLSAHRRVHDRTCTWCTTASKPAPECRRRGRPRAVPGSSGPRVTACADDITDRWRAGPLAAGRNDPPPEYSMVARRYPVNSGATIRSGHKEPLRSLPAHMKWPVTATARHAPRQRHPLPSPARPRAQPPPVTPHPGARSSRRPAPLQGACCVRRASAARPLTPRRRPRYLSAIQAMPPGMPPHLHQVSAKSSDTRINQAQDSRGCCRFI